MTVTNWITVAGIVVTAIIALTIAAQNRKQQRHLEAYRQDPSIGLKPPPHLITVFLLRYGFAAWLAGFGGFLIVREFSSPMRTAWVNRSSILEIVLGVVSVFLSALSLTFDRLSAAIDRLSKRLDALESKRKQLK